MEKDKTEREIWEVKVKKAIEIFSVVQNEVHNSIISLIEEINHLELRMNELLKSLEVINSSVDANVSLFSPYENKKNKQEELSFKKELLDIQNDLPIVKERLRNLQSKQDEYKLVNECLSYLSNILMYQANIEKRSGQTKILEENVNKFCDNYSMYYGIKILETQELERQRIARDLHDSTIQNLTNLMYKTELCIKLIDMDTIRARLELATLINQIHSIINDMREIIYDLRPMAIQDLGLVPAIERFAKKYMEQNHIQVIVNSTKENPKILPVINLTLYRIVQEACNNIVKYADANICTISVTYNERELKLVVEDNGVGILLDEREGDCINNSGFGLSIMRERALLLSGSFDIESTKDKGTKITVIIPYREQEEE